MSKALLEALNIPLSKTELEVQQKSNKYQIYNTTNKEEVTDYILLAELLPILYNILTARCTADKNS